MNFRVVIPARFGSLRLPGKPLLDVAGRALILRTADRARASGAAEVVVATDDERIANVCKDDNLDVVMTAVTHESGSDRIAEVARLKGWSADAIVVNVQGDEPCIPPAIIRQVASLLVTGEAEIATLATPVADVGELNDPNVVKVVVNSSGHALYFSRAPIPWDRDGANTLACVPLRHLGIYAYRVNRLERFAGSPVCALETRERLEQLRALWNGWSIRVATAVQVPGPGVDTPADLAAACDYFQSRTGAGEV